MAISKEEMEGDEKSVLEMLTEWHASESHEEKTWPLSVFEVCVAIRVPLVQ